MFITVGLIKIFDIEINVSVESTGVNIINQNRDNTFEEINKMQLG